MYDRTQCLICGLKIPCFKGPTAFGPHLKHSHNLSHQQYYDLFFKVENEDLCKCGCGLKTNWSNHDKEYKTYFNTSHVMKHFHSKHPGHAVNLGKKYGPIYGKQSEDNLKKFASDPEHQKMARKFQDIRHPGLASKRAREVLKNNPHIKEKLKLYIKEHPDHQSKAGQATQRKHPHVKNNAFNGKIRPVYKRVKMRSSWETRFAELCDKNRVNWEYEPKRFTLSNNGSYTPDFYLKDFELWVEIKPKVRQTEKALNKLKQLPNSSKILDLSEFESFFKTLLNQ